MSLFDGMQPPADDLQLGPVVPDLISERERGILHKYDVRRVNDPTGKHDDCRYFVLDPQHDPIARKALRIYAIEAERAGYVALAVELSDWLRGGE